VGEFGGDNRAGIDKTLHRISCIRNRTGRVVGLTCRVGRAIQGSADMVDDLIRRNASVLMLGALWCAVDAGEGGCGVGIESSAVQYGE
jgi:stage III sporulation protein SpoIIIAA